MTNVPFFDLKSQVAKDKIELLNSIGRVIDSGNFISGHEVEKFESNFANFSSTKYCVALGNGLDALRLSLECLNIGPGDEVIVPGFTFYATWLSVLQVGAIPVPVDVEIDSANIDPLKIEAAITKKTKAIITVHLYGFPAKLDQILRICKRNGIHLLEDAAQSHGAKFHDQTVGSWGIIGSFSFYPTKNLGALGDSGCIVTDDESIAQKMKSRRSYGQGKSKYDHVDLGWNTRMDEIQAAVLNLNLNKLETRTKTRQQIAQKYRSALNDKVQFNLGPNDIENSVWHHFVLRVKNRTESSAWFSKREIATDVHYPYFFSDVEPISKLHTNKQLSRFKLTNSNLLSKEVISLPIGPWMSTDQISCVVNALEELPRELMPRD